MRDRRQQVKRRYRTPRIHTQLTHIPLFALIRTYCVASNIFHTPPFDIDRIHNNTRRRLGVVVHYRFDLVGVDARSTLNERIYL